MKRRAYFLAIVYEDRAMKFRQTLFWDVDPETIDVKRHARYIIERVLELGEPREVGWLFRQYPIKEIKRVMDLPRSQISAKSKALWSLLAK